MRTIKFRFWNREKREMQYPFKSVYFKMKPDGIDLDKKLFYIKVYEDVCDAMQFTGLHDKDGKEIYEGDIVKVNYYGEKYLATVVWKNKFASFGLEQADKSPERISRFDYQTELEVVSNIYEDPDFLNSLLTNQGK